MNDTIFDVQECYGTDVGDMNNLCVICYTETSNTIVLPCRHLSLCKPCSQIVRIQNNKCPICRSEVQKFV